MKTGRKSGQRHRVLLISSLTSAWGVVLLRSLGVLQTWELTAFDQLLQLRPAEKPDARIVLVSVGESDLQKLGNGTLSDQVVAQLLQKIKAQAPRVIGLDLYRNLPMEPGHAALRQVFKSTPNLIGIQKIIGNAELAAVPGNPVLLQAGQLAASDLAVDFDGRVRRGLLFPKVVADGSTAIEGIGLRVALDYLAGEGIQPDAQAQWLRLNGVDFPELLTNAGGYVGADTRGYQILLNHRSGEQQFLAVSASDVLTGKIPPLLMRDRVVMVGSTAMGDADVFFTSYSSSQGGIGRQPRVMFGVELHATLASQIISAVLDGRSLIRVMPKWVEFGLMLLVAYGSVWVYGQRLSSWRKLGLIAGLVGFLGLGSYGGLLLAGWWVPLVPLLLAIALGTAGMLVYDARRLRALSTRDELTRLANRRVFNETLEREWGRALRSQTSLSLIMCDVDYFKIYNDTYGHPQGDECLRQVAQVLQSTLQRPADLAVRYGGEEFAILLPNTNGAGAVQVAEKLREAVRSRQLPHGGSQVSDYVSLSFGVASMIPAAHRLPAGLVQTADLGLYAAKQQGRNRVVLMMEELLDSRF
jgi:adenylate cyclase